MNYKYQLYKATTKPTFDYKPYRHDEPHTIKLVIFIQDIYNTYISSNSMQSLKLVDSIQRMLHPSKFLIFQLNLSCILNLFTRYNYFCLII